MDTSGSKTRRAAATGVLALTLCASTTAVNTATAAPAPAASAAVSAATAASHKVDAVSYADALIRAWAAGNRKRASYYATPTVVAQLFRFASPGGHHWQRTDVQGAAGTTYVTYRNTRTGQLVAIGVSNVALAQGDIQDAYTVTFG